MGRGRELDWFSLAKMELRGSLIAFTTVNGEVKRKKKPELNSSVT